VFKRRRIPFSYTDAQSLKDLKYIFFMQALVMMVGP
jgi:hypothetical protein